MRKTYYGSVEGETVAKPRLIPELLVVAAHERICGCVERGRVGFVSGGHLSSRSVLTDTDNVENLVMDDATWNGMGGNPGMAIQFRERERAAERGVLGKELTKRGILVFTLSFGCAGRC